jgi:citrate lyase subunit beta/citryl-CoA lyase
MLLGAHAAAVSAIETIYPTLNDEVGLAAYAARGRRDGFTGMLAIHPGQVSIINGAFAPTPDEIAWVSRVVELFSADPGEGVFQLDGKMVDAPHLRLARQLLARS